MYLMIHSSVGKIIIFLKPCSLHVPEQNTPWRHKKTRILFSTRFSGYKNGNPVKLKLTSVFVVQRFGLYVCTTRLVPFHKLSRHFEYDNFFFFLYIDTAYRSACPNHRNERDVNIAHFAVKTVINIQ